MKLKRKLTVKAYEKLSDELKEFYFEKDGEYFLDSDEDEGIEKLRRAKQRESEKHSEWKERAEKAEKRLNELDENSARKKGDIEVLDNSWKKKFNESENKFKEQLKSKDSFIKETLIDNIANKLASGYKNPKLMLPHIKSRINVDLSENKPVARILDKNNKISAMTSEDLKKELDSEFSDMVIISHASGGSTTKNKTIEGSASQGSKLDWSKNPSPAEVARYYEQNPIER